MKKIARMLRAHQPLILNWFEARGQVSLGGYVRFRTIRTVIFLIAGKLDFSRINPYVPQPT